VIYQINDKCCLQATAIGLNRCYRAAKLIDDVFDEEFISHREIACFASLKLPVSEWVVGLQSLNGRL
jgi:hypothetical protein